MPASLPTSNKKRIMKKQFIYILGCSALLSSCHIYSNYERPTNLPTDSLYRDTTATYAVLESDTINFGNMPWQEVFTDPLLQNLIQKALDNNTDLRTADLTVQQAEASLMSSRLAFLPSVTFSPEGTLSKVQHNSLTKTYTLPIQASWQIDVFGSLRNSKKQAQMSLLQSKAALQATRTSVIASVANMYYTLQMLDEQLKTTQETAILWEKNVKAMEAMKEAAMTNEAAVSQAKANYYEIKATIPELEDNIRQTENAICVLLHEAPHPVQRNTFSEEKFPQELSAGVPIQLLSNRPDVKAAEMQLAYCFYGVNAARSAFYPQITLTGSAGWSNSLGGIIANPAQFLASGIASLVQPLFMRGQLRANLKISKAQMETAQLNFEQSLLNAGQEVSNALSAYQTAIRQAASRELEVKELEKAAEKTQALFMHGNGTTYLETLTAQQSLLDAQLSLISDRFDKVQAAITLYQALGGGREN